MKKNIIRGIVTILFFLFVLFVLDKVLMLKSEDGIEQMRSFYKQKKNTVDVLFLGNSHVYCHIDTGILWDEHGMSSFDLGGAEAPAWTSYYYLKEALKTQKPKVIFYEASIAGMREDILLQPEVWSITNNYGMHLNINRFEQLWNNTTKDMFFKLMIPLNTTHARYNELQKDDFVDSNNSINYKGFDPRETVVECETPDVKNITEVLPFNEKHEKYIREIIALAKENNIPIVVMIAPYQLSENDQMHFNYLKQICEEEAVTYINYNELYDEIGLDFKSDMAEPLHLNMSGNKKWTEYLGNYIVNNYEITDHRGDNNYDSWVKDAIINSQNRNRASMQATKDGYEYLDYINNENYILFVTAREGIDDQLNDSNIREKLTNAGLTEDILEPYKTSVICNKEVLFCSSDVEYSGFINEGDVKLKLYKKEGTNVVNLMVDEDNLEFDDKPLNIIVYDRVMKMVVDNVGFDLGEEYKVKR